MIGCVHQDVFKLTLMLATTDKGERVQKRARGRKKKKEKEGNVFLTHTAPSFCSVTRLRSAGPPFSQS